MQGSNQGMSRHQLATITSLLKKYHALVPTTYPTDPDACLVAGPVTGYTEDFLRASDDD
jgi:hypothetical protein